MSIQSDHKALVFLGFVAVLGAGVHVVRASGEAPNGSQPALEHQAQAADSAARAGRSGRGGRGRGRGRGGGGNRRVVADSATRGRADSTQSPGAGALDRRGYVNGKLDLDIATAAQIDALPGMSATMARRIVLDRALRGPFVTKDGLRRVTGVGPSLLAKIDTLVTFSGTFTQPSPTDTVIARNRKVRPKTSTRPAAPRTRVPPPAPSLPEDADTCSPDPVSAASSPPTSSMPAHR